MGNQTRITEFLLLGLTDHPEHQQFLFVIFLSMYLTALAGNAAIISVIVQDSQLHTPMYAFLSHFSLVDFAFTSVTVPQLLVHLLSERSVITFLRCMVQIYFFHFLGNFEHFLLAVMAYDRYVAICHPLHYAMVMRKEACLYLMSVSFLSAALHSLIHCILTSQLDFCETNYVHHFICDIPPLQDISCTDTTINWFVLFFEGSAIALVPFLLTVISYIYIFTTVMKMCSASGRKKAFSTCASHLIVYTLFSGTAIFMYFRPSTYYTLNTDRVVTAMYTAVTPMLNPFIYCLRNKDVKLALLKALHIKLPVDGK